MGRILLVSNTVMHYRVSVYNYLYQRFCDHGWEWHVLANEVQVQSQIEPLFPLEALPFNFLSYRRRIKAINPDVVILFLHLKDFITWPLVHWLKCSRIPFASWTKTRNLDDPHNPIRNILFAYINEMSDGLILYANHLAGNLTPRQRKKAFVANNTINHLAFPPVYETREQIKKSLGIPFEKVVLFAGRMNVDGGRKRVDYLIDIFRRAQGGNHGLVIVGSGLSSELRARINPKNTIYLGEVHDPDNRQIARIFSMADLCVIPGHVGLGLNQALYYGLPVITMAGSQPPEICNLHDGRNGFIVPSGDIRQLEEKIFLLLKDDRLRRDFSESARQDFIAEASIQGMFQGFYDCVQFLHGPAKLSKHPAFTQWNQPHP